MDTRKGTETRLVSWFAFAATTALLSTAAEVPEAGSWLAPVALVPMLLAILRAPAPALAFRYGWASGAIFLGLSHSWILGVSWGAVPWMVLPAVAASLAGSIGAFAACVAWLVQRGGMALAVLAVPLLWLLAEQVFAVGAPWLQLGAMAAYSGPVAQLADLAGVDGLTTWTAGTNALVAGAVLSARRDRSWRAVSAGLTAAVWAVSPGWYAMACCHDLSSWPPVVRVAVVQPATGPDQRFVERWRGRNLTQLLQLSQDTLAGAPDLVAWPETAWERGFGVDGDPLLGSVARALEVPIVTGGRRPGTRAGAIYNSVALATPDGRSQIVADKLWPVPAYESMPDTATSRWLAARGVWPGRVEAGRGRTSWSFIAGRDVRIGVFVCFDIHDANVVRRQRRSGAALVLGLFNEADAGDRMAARNEALSRLRAIENRVPLVRVANTGRSVWYDAKGDAVAALPRGQSASATAAVLPAGSLPLAARFGELLAWVACFGAACIGCAYRILRARSSSKQPERNNP